MKKIIALIVILIPLALLSQIPKGTIELKFNFQKGVKYELSYGADMSIKQTMLGQDVNVKMITIFNYLMEVVKDSSSWKNVEATLTNIKTIVNTNGNSIVMDPESKDTSGPGAMSSKLFKALKGTKFGFTVNKEGSMMNITGFSEMRERMKKSLPDNPQVELVLQGFDENAFKQSTEQLFGAYPSSPVKVGESWQKTVKVVSRGMDVVSHDTYILEAVKNNEAVVRLTSTLTSDGPMIIPGGGEADAKMTGTKEATLHYNIASGLQTLGDMKIKMDMNIKSNGMEIPMKMDMNIITKGNKL